MLLDPTYLPGLVTKAAEQVNNGDTAWLLASAAMVMLMTPAVGFFYGGMVRRHNALATMMQSFIVVAVIGVQWILWGYSLAFGPDHGHFIGGLDWFGLRNVGLDPNPDYGPTVPHQAFMIFQGMFAIITPALITGAFAERMKFSAFLLFTVLWATLVYDPVAHWVWGMDGWLRNMGALDFAGGLVVHINAGAAALAAALVMGKRLGYGKEPIEAHNNAFIILGAGLLWFGWFGFNAGSAISSGSLATSAFVVTNSAAAMGALTWMTISWYQTGKASVVGAATGAVVGLAAVTPAAGYVDPMVAIIIGAGAGVFCYMAMRLRAKLGFDDSLDVWAGHGIGSTWGVLAAGLFATVAVNANGANGLFNGNPSQLLIQLVAVLAVWTFSFGMTVGIMKVLDKLVGLRVNEDAEAVGLDLSEHGEEAYQL